MFKIKIIDEKHKNDINIPNEPFALTGKMLPRYVDGKWSFDVVKFDDRNVKEMCFPDENYDFDEMKQNSVFIGAYKEEKCVGLAILQDAPFKFMYLYDLKVAKDYRHQGVAKLLLEKAKEVCKQKGYNGIYTQGQDNNLSACLFYIKFGFHIGGFDTDIYKGTKQEGKADIIFYLDC